MQSRSTGDFNSVARIIKIYDLQSKQWVCWISTKTIKHFKGMNLRFEELDCRPVLIKEYKKYVIYLYYNFLSTTEVMWRDMALKIVTIFTD